MVTCVTLNSMYKIGQGIDIHKLTKGNQITIGNLKFDSEYNTIAHSDGDVVLHSLTDAILGALSLDDIGTYFPDTSSENKDRNSLDFLTYALDKMKDEKYTFNNIDITIICNQVMINSIKDDIKNNLINILGTKNISLKATRFEEEKQTMEVRSIILLKK